MRLTPRGTRNSNFDPNLQSKLGPAPLWRLSDSPSKNYSWVKIGVKTVKISRKPCQARQHTSQGHNFWSNHWFSISLVFWKLYIQSFLGTPRSIQFESRKTFKYAFKAGPEKAEIADVSRVADGHTRCARSQRFNFPQIKISRPLILPKKKKDFWQFPRWILSLLSLIYLPNTSKHIQTPLILLFSPQSQGSILAPNLPLLGSIPWIWGLGVWI